MAMICGWVVIFRVILTFLQICAWNGVPNFAQIILTGLLELSNGCLALPSIEVENLRFLLASIMLSLGGICVWMQTNAVFPELNLARYIAGRWLHCLISISLSLLSITFLSGQFALHNLLAVIVAVLSVMILLHILFKPKKEVAFYQSMMYNG